MGRRLGFHGLAPEATLWHRAARVGRTAAGNGREWRCVEMGGVVLGGFGRGRMRPRFGVPVPPLCSRVWHMSCERRGMKREHVTTHAAWGLCGRRRSREFVARRNCHEKAQKGTKGDVGGNGVAFCVAALRGFRGGRRLGFHGLAREATVWHRAARVGRHAAGKTMNGRLLSMGAGERSVSAVLFRTWCREIQK